MVANDESKVGPAAEQNKSKSKGRGRKNATPSKIGLSSKPQIEEAKGKQQSTRANNKRATTKEQSARQEKALPAAQSEIPFGVVKRPIQSIICVDSRGPSY